MSLPKVISQETFDQVVLENVVDFDKPLQEAIEEAVKDFEVQGVLLTNIIKSVSLGPNNDCIVHPILESLKILQDDGTTNTHLIETLNKFGDECKLSLAHRVMAAKNGAYKTMIAIITKAKDSTDVLVQALHTIYVLTDGNPDILDNAGVQLMSELMQQYHLNPCPEYMEMLAKWCHSCILKHENNRQYLFAANIPHYLVSSLTVKGDSAHNKRIIATLKAIKGFTLDDDIRAEFGKAHENCRHLVEDENFIPITMDIINAAQDSSCVVVAGDGLSSLSSVCVRAEYCVQAVDVGALDAINGLLDKFCDSALINKQSINLIATLAGDDKVKVQAIERKSHEFVTEAMKKHQLHVGVCTAGCSAVSMLALRHPKHAEILLKQGTVAAVVQAMKQHPKEKQLQKMGCLALRNLCSRSPTTAAALRDMEADTVVQTAVTTHGSVLADMAKAALRDMGVDVALEEQWHGKGHEIQQGI